jgi:hypothetical protein
MAAERSDRRWGLTARGARWAVVPLAVLGCALAPATATTARGSATPAPWTPWLHARSVVDVIGPRSDGQLVVAADRRLWLLSRGGSLAPFAQGPGGYAATGGGEPYIALPGTSATASGACPFGRDAVYALEPRGNAIGILRVGADGNAGAFARVPGAALLSGIAFDEVGRFGHRLLVVGNNAAGVSGFVAAVDCRGRVTVLSRSAPRVEGGIVVAPAGFGAFGGELVAPDEHSGFLYAFAPDGRARVMDRPPVPHGPDIGIESAGFAPAAATTALVADRLTPGNHHPGTDSLLRLSLRSAGVRPGDLVLVSEASATTVAVRCATTCHSRVIATGPPKAHVEGHVAFLR